MSYLLRHGAQKEHLSMNAEGYIQITDVITWLQAHGLQVCKDTIVKIVQEDKKGRYSIVDDCIRANQGHSLQLALSYTEYTSDAQVVHIVHT